MAKLKKPPIPLKMYKHFAVVTLTLTAGIAMFADGDHQATVAGKFEERRRENELLSANAAAFGAPKLVQRNPAVGEGTFGHEGSDMGAPTLVVRRGDSGHRAPSPRSPNRPPVEGYDQAFIDGMTESEYRSFLQMTAEVEVALSREERDQARRTMMERQRRQAGSSTSSDYIE